MRGESVRNQKLADGLPRGSGNPDAGEELGVGSHSVHGHGWGRGERLGGGGDARGRVLTATEATRDGVS